MLRQVADGPMAQLNEAITIARVDGPAAGLRLLDGIALDSHHIDAVRGHLLEKAGGSPGAIAAYQRAAQRTTSLPEQTHLFSRAAKLGET